MKDSPIPKFLSAILVLCFCTVFGSAPSQASTNDLATYTITGTVTTTTGTPITNVVVFANTYINGTNYQTNGITDSTGTYTVNVSANAEWYLTPDCYEYTNNLDHQGYLCVDSEYVKMGTTNGTANFETIPYSASIDELDGTVADANKNPIVGVTVYIINPANGQTNNATTDVNGFYRFFVPDETSWNLYMDCEQLAGKGYGCPAEITNAIIHDRSTCCQNFTLVPSTNTPAFFTGEVALGSDWYWMGPQGSNSYGFGYFYAADAPYYFHEDLGWEYFIDAADASQGAYFYDFTDDVWWYSQPSLFPYMYDFKMSAWMYCAPQTNQTDRYQTDPRWFLNLSTKQWGNSL